MILNCSFLACHWYCVSFIRCGSLDRLVYGPEDKVKIQLQIENNSAVDVSGSTLKVIFLVIIGYAS